MLSRENKDVLFEEFHLTKIGLFGSFFRNENILENGIMVEFKENTQDLFHLKEKSIRQTILIQGKSL